MSDPLVLFSHGSEDPDFYYAAGMAVEPAAYVRFDEGDDVLIVSILELDRARQSTSAQQVLDRTAVGWSESENEHGAWAKAVATVLQGRGLSVAEVSPRLEVAYYEELKAAGVHPHINRELFRTERRRKAAEEAAFIHAAQRAAEAACVEVISNIGVAETREGMLWMDGRPLTSEQLRADAISGLTAIGYSCDEIIIAGSPENALPHHRGHGHLRAGAPIIIDIFPRGSSSHYHGDLTRTVVAGEVPAEVGRMHEAVVAALDAAIAEIRPGANGRDVHRTVCRVLVDAGYGTATTGFEGSPGVARMIHSTGHGVGLQVHEKPDLRDRDVVLAVGDVITVEPGLYLGGLGGVRVEDTGIVTEAGFRNFTSLPRSLLPGAYM